MKLFKTIALIMVGLCSSAVFIPELDAYRRQKGRSGGRLIRKSGSRKNYQKRQEALLKKQNEVVERMVNTTSRSEYNKLKEQLKTLQNRIEALEKAKVVQQEEEAAIEEEEEEEEEEEASGD